MAAIGEVSEDGDAGASDRDSEGGGAGEPGVVGGVDVKECEMRGRVEEGGGAGGGVGGDG